MPAEAAADALIGQLGWREPERGIVPLGQAAAFAAPFAERYATFGRLAHAMLDESERRLEQAVALDPLGAGHGVAAPHGTTFPIVQGPMTRVSDVAGFAQAVAEAGALPMLALALMRPEQVDALLAETTARLAGKPWGVGLLGFAPADLIHAQTEIARKYAPRFALIAGGRPDQARSLEEEGVTSYLHVPSPRLLTLFLEQGARRFVFEGRECGGHVGPLLELRAVGHDGLDAARRRARPGAGGGDPGAVRRRRARCAVRGDGGGDRGAARRARRQGRRAGRLRVFVHPRDRRDRGGGPRISGGGARLLEPLSPWRPARVTRAGPRCRRLPRTSSPVAANCEPPGAPPTRSGRISRPVTLGRLRVASKGQERAGQEGRCARRRPPARSAKACS